MGHGLGTIRVVQIQDSRLSEDAGRPKAGWMIRVPFDLRWPSLVTFHKDAGSVAAELHGGGKEERFARDDLLRLPHVRDDPFNRLLGAGAETRQRQGSAHEFQEIPPAERVRPFRSPGWKLAVQEIEELRRPGGFLETAPILPRSGRVHFHFNGGRCCNSSTGPWC